MTYMITNRKKSLIIKLSKLCIGNYIVYCVGIKGINLVKKKKWYNISQNNKKYKYQR